VRILLCHNIYSQRGGEDRLFGEETEILRRRGEDVELYLRDSKEIQGQGWRARASTVASGFYSLRSRRELRAAVERFRPDVAIVQNVFPLLSPSAYHTLAERRVPIVQLVFNYRLLCPNASLFTAGALCGRCIGGNTLHAVRHRCLHDSRAVSLWYAGILGIHRRLGTFRRAITRFVVPHPFVGRKLVEGGLPEERIRVNPNPYSLPPRPAGEDPETYVAFAGRFVPEKGVLTLVRALALVPGLRAVLVGDGPLLPAVRTEIAATPGLAERVELTGWLPAEATQDRLRGAAVFVLPTNWHDISPLLLYDALALGKPSIASHLGSNPQIVSDGVDGLIFTAGDVADLARKLERLAADPALRRRMGEAARRKAESELEPERHYRRLRAILEEAVAAGTPA
jgi:glycosyltransferase involved in cell wall biosynthesis